MTDVKEMTYGEKYAIVMDDIDFTETLVPAFIEEHLGDSAVTELKTIWKEGTEPIPEQASDEEKYEIAYRNWIWMGKNEFSFIRRQMGEEGIEQFVRSEVEALTRKNAGPALFFLRLIRAISPGSAFTMTAKEFAYQLQWITPFSVSELTQHRAVFDIPRCKILDFQESDDLCRIACQGIYPEWVAEQFKVKMEFDPQGNSCTCTLSPME